MGRQRINIVGQRFGKLEVIRFSHKDKRGHRKFLCRCDCGKFKVIAKSSLTSGKTRSCGCLAAEQGTKQLEIYRNSKMLNTNITNKQEEDTYCITPKGVLYCELKDDALSTRCIDALELQARRFYQKNGNYAAIVFDEAGPRFVSLERHED